MFSYHFGVKLRRNAHDLRQQSLADVHFTASKRGAERVRSERVTVDTAISKKVIEKLPSVLRLHKGEKHSIAPCLICFSAARHLGDSLRV